MYGPRSKTTSLTPALVARSASSLPTAAAAATSAPVFSKPFRSFSRLEAEATVWPFESSMTCAWIFFDERYTDRRRRPLATALTWRRMRCARRWVYSFEAMLLLPCLHKPGAVLCGRHCLPRLSPRGVGLSGTILFRKVCDFSGSHAASYFFLPSLRTMRSPAYFTPLP